MRMTKQPTSTTVQPVPIQWPELNLPVSTSKIKGLTDEQHAALGEWYLGVKNVVNNHNANVISTLTNLQTQISALKTAKTVAS
jgi:hypothetical protein